MFWIENCVIVPIFILFEFLLVLPVYFKNIYILAMIGQTPKTQLKNAAISIIAGLPIALFIVGSDVYNLIIILRMHEGCRAYNGMKNELEEEKIPEDVVL